MDVLLTYFEELRAHCRNNVQGHLLSAPAVASTPTQWDVGVSSCIITVEGVSLSLYNSGTDYTIYDQISPIISTNQSCVAAFVAYLDDGVIVHTNIRGTVAANGVAPTAEEITASVGGCPWIRLGETTLRNTGGIVTQEYDSTRRPILGVTVAPTIGDCTFVDRLKDAGL